MAAAQSTNISNLPPKGNHDAKRAALDLLLILILSAPSNHAGRNSTGIWGVNRQGCRFSRPAPWMARGGAPQITGGLRAHRAWARCRVVGQEPFWLLLGLFSKSDPLSERNPKWPLPQQWICTQSNCVDCQAAFASKPAQLDRGVSGREVSAGRSSSQASQLPQLDCGVSGRYGAAGGPSSQASQLPHEPSKPSPNQLLCNLLINCASA